MGIYFTLNNFLSKRRF